MKNNLKESAEDERNYELESLDTTERVIIRDIDELEKSANIPHIYPSVLSHAISSILTSILNYNECINFNRFVNQYLSDEEYSNRITALINTYTRVKKLRLTIFHMFNYE